MELAQLGNVYFDTKKPWQDAKQPETHAAMQTTIACCFECLKLLALVSSPIIPESANKIWQMLGNEGVLSVGEWDSLKQQKTLTNKLNVTETRSDLNSVFKLFTNSCSCIFNNDLHSTTGTLKMFNSK